MTTVSQLAAPASAVFGGYPNGVKVTVMSEELLALGHSGAEYDAWLIRINEGELWGSGLGRLNRTPDSLH